MMDRLAVLEQRTDELIQTQADLLPLCSHRFWIRQVGPYSALGGPVQIKSFLSVSLFSLTPIAHITEAVPAGGNVLPQIWTIVLHRRRNAAALPPYNLAYLRKKKLPAIPSVDAPVAYSTYGYFVAWRGVLLISLDTVEGLFPSIRAISLMDFCSRSRCSIWLRSSFVKCLCFAMIINLYKVTGADNAIFSKQASLQWPFA